MDAEVKVGTVPPYNNPRHPEFYKPSPAISIMPPDLNSKPTNPKDAIASTTKVPLGLVPDTAVVAMAMGFLEGALKYGRFNWRIAGVRASVYLDALERHMKAWRNGEDIDPDSGLPHPWKALCCLAVLVDAMQCGKLVDDRPPRAPVAEMMGGLRDQIGALMEKYGSIKPKQYTIADTPLLAAEPPEGV